MSDITTLASDMTEAVNAYLETLTNEQRKKTSLTFNDEDERRRWFYTPTPRPGLSIGEMAPNQQQRVFAALAVGLSEAGYNYASTVMGLEHLVDFTSNFPDRTYGDLPNTRVRDPGNYCVAVFGSPADANWTWRIGGHHLSLQFTVQDDSVSVTPAFFGAEPAHVKMPGGVLLRALAAEEDNARNLLLMLDGSQQNRAILSPIAPTDIVQRNAPLVEDGALPQIGGNGPGGQALRDKLRLTPAHDEMYRYSVTPKGLPAGEMSTSQRQALEGLVRVYFDHLAEPIRRQYDRVFEAAAFDATTFSWAGPPEFGAPHYYRVQGERLLIEYDCTQNDANHTHSVWRDPEGDFGDDILARHYAMEHSR